MSDWGDHFEREDLGPRYSEQQRPESIDTTLTLFYNNEATPRPNAAYLRTNQTETTLHDTDGDNTIDSLEHTTHTTIKLAGITYRANIHATLTATQFSAAITIDDPRSNKRSTIGYKHPATPNLHSIPFAAYWQNNATQTDLETAIHTQLTPLLPTIDEAASTITQGEPHIALNIPYENQNQIEYTTQTP